MTSPSEAPCRRLHYAVVVYGPVSRNHDGHAHGDGVIAGSRVARRGRTAAVPSRCRSLSGEERRSAVQTPTCLLHPVTLWFRAHSSIAAAGSLAAVQVHPTPQPRPCHCSRGRAKQGESALLRRSSAITAMKRRHPPVAQPGCRLAALLRWHGQMAAQRPPPCECLACWVC